MPLLEEIHFPLMIEENYINIFGELQSIQQTLQITPFNKGARLVFS